MSRADMDFKPILGDTVRVTDDKMTVRGIVAREVEVPCGCGPDCQHEDGLGWLVISLRNGSEHWYGDLAKAQWELLEPSPLRKP